MTQTHPEKKIPQAESKIASSIIDVSVHDVLLPYMTIYADEFEDSPDGGERPIRTARKAVVVDGDPFYLSACINSGAPHPLWLPWIMMRAREKYPYLVGIPEIYSIKKLAAILQDHTEPGIMLKLHPSFLKPTAIDINPLNETIPTHLGKPVKAKFSYSERLVTKKYLIISSRLSYGQGDIAAYPPKLLAQLGLNETEIIAAQKPLKLAKEAEKAFFLNLSHFQDRDEYTRINQWLASKGASVAGVVVKHAGIFGDTYDQYCDIWQKARGPYIKSPPDSKTDLHHSRSRKVIQAKTILRYYNKGSGCNRFFSGDWDRDDVAVINAILKTPYTNISDLLAALVIEAQKSNIKISGNLQKVIYFIKQQDSLEENDSHQKPPENKDTSTRTEDREAQEISSSPSAF